jgi:excisionase family DNA binding protein
MSSEALNTQTMEQAGGAELPKIGYSIKEASKIVGLGRTTLWKAVEDGKLTVIKSGRRRLFLLSDLQTYMDLLRSESVEPRRARAQAGES